MDLSVVQHGSVSRATVIYTRLVFFASLDSHAGGFLQGYVVGSQWGKSSQLMTAHSSVHKHNHGGNVGAGLNNAYFSYISEAYACSCQRYIHSYLLLVN